MFYVACWTEDDGIHCCGHHHLTLADAMKCLVPNGGFIRAFESGAFRSLKEAEFLNFMTGLETVPWHRAKTGRPNRASSKSGKLRQDKGKASSK